nr:hypothetical protein GCM10020092_096560 [Actinoplanes digitatis]
MSELPYGGAAAASPPGKKGPCGEQQRAQPSKVSKQDFPRTSDKTAIVKDLAVPGDPVKSIDIVASYDSIC